MKLINSDKKIGRIRVVITALILLLIGSSCSYNSKQAEQIPYQQQEMFMLLHEWCDALLARQIQQEDSLLDGGILCPACALIHGRTPDAIYPFLYVASCTGEMKYVEAAKKCFDWGERNVRFADGSWNNEANMYVWRGITVFGLITLAESLKDFSGLLDSLTRHKWLRSLKEQADFVVSYIRPGVGNINYSATACYALALAGDLLEEKQYKERAKELAALVIPYFTECDSLFYGEGVFPYKKSEKGLWPVDLGYNVEETLPNLLFYADLVKDISLKSKVQKSIRNQIEFMLPDGAWDNSWGTRNFKWSYWGSRTSDGVISLCSILDKEDSLYSIVGYRNFELLRKCTYNGLLYGGMHYRSAGYPACIHHTFEHAKGLAVALHRGFGKPERTMMLPREIGYGSRYFRDLDSWLISVGEWRATVSGYDVGYKMPGGNCHGGTLSLLWHKSVGPILAAAMTQYSIEEPANMQLLKGKFNYSPTFQIVFREKDKVYSNANCKKSKISCQSLDMGQQITVETELVDIASQHPVSGQMPIEINYKFQNDKVSIHVVDKSSTKNREIIMYMPVISQAGEKCSVLEKGFGLRRDGTDIYILSNTSIEQLPVEKNGRAFCPVPGFEFIPFCLKSKGELYATFLCE